MKNKLIGEAGEGTKATKQKTFAIIFNTGDEVVTGLKAFAEEKGLTASHFTAIGAFKMSYSATLTGTRRTIQRF